VPRVQPWTAQSGLPLCHSKQLQRVKSAGRTLRSSPSATQTRCRRHAHGPIMAHRPCRTTGAVCTALDNWRLPFPMLYLYMAAVASNRQMFGGATGATRGARPCVSIARQSPMRRVHAAARCQAEQTTEVNASPGTLQRRALLSASSILGVPSPHTLHCLAADRLPSLTVQACWRQACCLRLEEHQHLQAPQSAPSLPRRTA